MPPMDNLTALALVLAAAVVAGLAMNRARLPAAAGFILTGVLLGPTGFGVVARSDSIETLADLGVLLLLFIIGMELRLAGSASSCRWRAPSRRRRSRSSPASPWRWR